LTSAWNCAAISGSAARRPLSITARSRLLSGSAQRPSRHRDQVEHLLRADLGVVGELAQLLVGGHGGQRSASAFSALRRRRRP
jgi:hypothetical protein